MRVTDTIPQKPNTLTAIALTGGEGPQYACLDGLDAFVRVIEGRFTESSISTDCGIAYAY
ncbi:hypothetical protein [Actinomadura bangladeshensis]|uniref:Uncharacterized protein n=1 Tax=Actinomadura bangladeshensis TaxID=453573 RepID=A0A6L9QD11_9ACTN|nr:hypothetical protein [Actinomadura bangladeshensis]NEA22084.1 hypothetical protein [Actinomadura bangladeshensis]